MENAERVAYFHAYAEMPSKQDWKPDRSARLQTLAAGELLRRGAIDRAVFLAGHMSYEGDTTKEGLSLAEKMAAQLRRNLPKTPEGAIIAQPLAMSTRDEIREFKQLAEGQNWHLSIVGKRAHLKRMQRSVGRFFGKDSSRVQIMCHEDILAQKRYRKIIQAMQTSPEEQAFARRERIINLLDSIPLLGGWIIDNLNLLSITKILEARTYKALYDARKRD